LIAVVIVALFVCSALANPKDKVPVPGHQEIPKNPKEIEHERCKVYYVIDGDTFDCKTKDNKKVRVRMLGVDTLEVKHGKVGYDQCHGPEAEAYTKKLILDKWVSLRSMYKDSISGKRIARSVYVKRNGKWFDVARGLLANGHAVQFTRYHEFFHAKDYNRVAARARARGKNIWNTKYCGKGPAAKLKLFVKYNEKGKDINDEWVQITNLGTTAINLNRWILRHMLHTEHYSFKENAIIQPGKSLYVHSGVGVDNAEHVYWGLSRQKWWNPIPEIGWGNTAYLVDPKENFRFWYGYY